MNLITAIERFERFFDDHPEVAQELVDLAYPVIAIVPAERVEICRGCGYWPVEKGWKCPRCKVHAGTITISASAARTVETMVAATRG